MLEAVFSLRHQVYCEGLGFEPQRASRLEHDKYDQRSIHCLLLHRASKTYIGCVRLILADIHELEAAFPFETTCGKSLRWNFDSSAGNGRERYREVSRLAIVEKFRRFPINEPAGEDVGCADVYAGDEDQRFHFPTISLCLYWALTRIVRHQGLKGIFAVIKPSLARRLRRLNILFDQVGTVVDHHGLRVPIFARYDANLSTAKPAFWTLLSKDRNSLGMPCITTASSLTAPDRSLGRTEAPK